MLSKRYFESIPGILSKLKQVERELIGTKLVNLKSFNNTYLIITKNIYQGMQSGQFKNEKLVQQLIINFLNYYFKALKDYQKKLSIPEAWAIALRFCEGRRSNHLMYLAIAANAHINNDLAFALRETIKKENFYSDYQKIGEVIELSIKESILSINQFFPVLNFIDKHLLWLYKIIIKFLLKEWRRMAWNNYLKLMKRDKIEDQIKLVAARKANEISLIAYLIPFY